MVVYICNFSIREAEMGRWLWVWGQPESLRIAWLTEKDPVSKKQNKNKNARVLLCSSKHVVHNEDTRFMLGMIHTCNLRTLGAWGQRNPTLSPSQATWWLGETLLKIKIEEVGNVALFSVKALFSVLCTALFSMQIICLPACLSIYLSIYQIYCTVHIHLIHPFRECSSVVVIVSTRVAIPLSLCFLLTLSNHWLTVHRGVRVNVLST